MDSESSDGIELNGKVYRLKCDCCRANRKETEYDFHPCKVDKCTFAICWPCLQKWKDQSDKDITKPFACPQCHTEYDTKQIERHKPLSKREIARINEVRFRQRRLKRQQRELKKAALHKQKNKNKKRRRRRRGIHDRKVIKDPSIHPIHRQMNATLSSMNDIHRRSPPMVNNVYLNGVKHVIKSNTAPPGMNKVAMNKYKAPPGMQKVAMNSVLNGHLERKRGKIDKIMEMTHVNALKEEKEDEWKDIVEWKCDNVKRSIHIVSDDEHLSDFMDNIDSESTSERNDELTEHNDAMASKQQSVASISNASISDYNLNYDYSSSEDDYVPKVKNAETVTDFVGNVKNIHDMTIQEMLDNLEHFEGDQVDAILAKLLSKNDHETKRDGNEVNNEENDIKNEENKAVEDEVVLESFDDVQHDEHHQDLHIIAASLTGNKERHRTQMEDIAKHYATFNLAKLPNLYYERCNKKIKRVYGGKIKDLIKYFGDIFAMKYNPHNNQTVVTSLLHSKEMKAVKAKQTLKWKKKDGIHENNTKNIDNVHRYDQNNNMNTGTSYNDEDFRYGPSMMYTVPRYVGRSKKNRDHKVKTYGDFQDALPTTPSGSEDDSD